MSGIWLGGVCLLWLFHCQLVVLEDDFCCTVGMYWIDIETIRGEGTKDSHKFEGEL